MRPVLSLLLAGAAAALVGCGPFQQRATTTADVVRSSIAAGLEVDWLPPRSEANTTILAGVARMDRRSPALGFAVALSSETPELERLEQWPAAFEFDAAENPRKARFADGRLAVPIFRGVVGNASYANYLLSDKPRDRFDEPEKGEARIALALDRALLASFPPGSPDVEAMSPTP